jgi:hypothetical protein
VVKNNHYKYLQLQKEFNFFSFESFSVDESAVDLTITYEFNLADKFFFTPSIIFKKGDFFTDKLSASVIENFAFQTGLIELISYWKAACTPKIIIKPYRLNPEQVIWWKKLWFNGLGEFYYLNNIITDKESFVDIVCDSNKILSSSKIVLNERKVLVPIGGGKDSAVTLELLKDHFRCLPVIVNPRQASLGTALTAGFKRGEILEVHRSIHPQLLRLNESGFLNGHTPFSALLAFISIMAAYFTGTKSIALSNESSANEPTDSDSGINHQYSKSYEFEKDFRNYVNNFISPDINYFSFLRPINELTIARLFSGYPKYFSEFKSCNAGSKTDSWCGKCPKCLFTYIILSPFIDQEKLIGIFGQNLFEKNELIPTLRDLTGLSDIKPFDCVGTLDEVNFSLCRTIEKYEGTLPNLLEYYISSSLYKKYKDSKWDLFSYDASHFLGEDMFAILKNATGE